MGTGRMDADLEFKNSTQNEDFSWEDDYMNASNLPKSCLERCEHF